MRLIPALSILILVVVFGLIGTAAPMTVSDAKNELGGLLWIPCQAGQCLLDTAGSGSIMTHIPENAHYPKERTIVIQTLQGPMICDLLKPINFELAGKTVNTERFIRCKDFPVKLSPMLGLDFFGNQRFMLSFSTSTFVWDSDGILTQNLFALDQTDGWIGMRGEFATQQLKVVFDTGAPTTLVDEDFVAQNENLFHEISYRSTVEGIRLVLPKEDLIINGVAITKQPWRVLPIKKSFSNNKQYVPEIMLGMNVIKHYDWFFDLPNLEASFRLLRGH
jgi:hypothetical protein